MRHVWRVLAVLWWLVLVSESEDAPACVQDVLSETNEYRCSGLVVTTTDSRKDTTIDCRGLPLDCSKLQLPHFENNKTLDRLTVRNCALTTSLECLMVKLHATGTRTIMFNAVSTPITEETMRGLHGLSSLFIFSSEQTVVPLAVLKMLPNLVKLRLTGASLTALPANSFHQPGLPILEYLEIALNNISTLPADAFNGLGNLTMLNLFKNKIENVDANAFRGLDSLKELFLDENRITVLPTGVFLHTPLLQTLTMPRSLRSLRLQTGALSGLQHLQELVLQSYETLSLEPRSLSHLPSLRRLVLTESGILELPADLLRNTTALLDLDLSGNNLSILPETVFEGLEQLQKLNLRKNKLKLVTKNIFEPLEGIQELHLDENRIDSLPASLFSTLLSLHTISLARNNISRVHELAFHGAAVTSLDLSRNQLAWRCYSDDVMLVDEYLPGFFMQSPLVMLDRLQELDLSHNSIGSICSDWRHVMTSLKELNLSFNKLTNLTDADTHFYSSSITVDLRDNQITTLTPPPYPQRNATLLLDRNPFHCDCHLYQLLKQLKYLPYNVGDATCKLPKSMKGRTLTSIAEGNLASLISLSNLTCPLPDTPKGCSTCVVRPASSITECDCNNISATTLPVPSNNGPTVKQMQLTLRTQQDLKGIPKFVTKMILSNLELETVPDIPETVAFLDLSHNKLSAVPLEVLRRNITLKLTGNRIKCDCESRDDVANLKSNLNKIQDAESLVCVGGGFLKDVDVPRLCNVREAMLIGSLVAAAGFVLAIAGILIYKYSLEIKIFLYNKGCSWLVKEEMLDANKKYHIFLSYVHEDEDFVQTHLLPELDKDYKVCVHTRDWIVGDKIVDQIYRSVEESRRTLIVLSKAFLESNSWALAEFEAAHAQSARDNLPRAVIILLDDVHCDSAPDHIKRHMKTNTYIKWGDDNFWERLRYALPRKMKAEDVRRKKMTALAAKNLAKSGLNVVLNEQGELVNAARGK